MADKLIIISWILIFSILGSSYLTILGIERGYVELNPIAGIIGVAPILITNVLLAIIIWYYSTFYKNLTHKQYNIIAIILSIGTAIRLIDFIAGFILLVRT